MEDLFELMQGTRTKTRARRASSSTLAAYALKDALGGEDTSGLESSWFDVDHHLAAKSAEVDDDFRTAAGEVENEELDAKLRKLENFDDEF